MPLQSTTARKPPAPNRECVRCAAPFYASPGHIRQGWGKFCGMQCRSLAYVGSGNPRWMGSAGDVICPGCQQMFRAKPSHIANNEGKFCSWVCRRKVKGKVELTCLGCKKNFMDWQSALKLGRSYCSKRCWDRVQSSDAASHRAWGTQKGGRREDIGLYVRSRWEANWARYLNLLKAQGQIADWAYEPETFEFPVKRGNRFYTPDFRVVLPDGVVEFHEVKGWMSPESKTKLKRMAKYHPDVKIVLIEKERYQGVARTVQALIPEWETDARRRP